jgi:hypothetical protein
VLALDVADLVADVEIERIRIVGKRIDDVGVQHQEIAPQEAGGEGIEGAAHLHQVGVRLVGLPELVAAGGNLAMEVGELLLGDLHAGALDMGNQGGLGEAVGQEEHQPIYQRQPERAEHQHEPQHRRQRQHDPEQRFFVLVDQVHRPSDRINRQQHCMKHTAFGCLWKIY